MKLLLKYVLKNIEENMGRTILIMLSLLVVSITVSVITLVIFFFGIIYDATENSNSFEYEIQSITNDYLSKKIVEEIKDEFNVLGIADFDYGYLLNDNEDYESVALEGFDIDKIIEFNFIKIDETENVELSENEVIITTDISKKYDLKKGDEFEYYGRNGENILSNL